VEDFVAAYSSYHMLTVLHMASQQGFQVDLYDDEAVGAMTKNDAGVPWISAITLRPRIAYGGERRPTSAEEDGLHHAAHEQCFIANSIKTEVKVSGR